MAFKRELAPGSQKSSKAQKKRKEGGGDKNDTSDV